MQGVIHQTGLLDKVTNGKTFIKPNFILKNNTI
jgi:hypothetical protein